jgi:cytoskeletal protein CcmA (bactofilin family)
MPSTIIIKNSSTAAAVPTAVDLVKGELAVNVTDKRLFTEDNSGNVVELGINPSSVTTGSVTSSGTISGPLTTSNATITGGTINNTTVGATTATTVRGTVITATTGFSGDLTGNVTGNVTGNLTGNVTASSGTSTVNNLVINGTVSGTGIPGAGTVTSVSGTGTVNGITLTGTVTSTGSLTLGGTLSNVSLTTQVTGTLPVANGGTGATTLAGANIPVTTAANTFTNTQTFSGSTSAFGVVLNDAAEVATVSATAATGTINYDITTQSVLYYTSNASANWTVNFRASSGTSLNTALATGQSVTVAFLVTQGSTAYYNNVVQVDGSSVTPKWQGGTAPAAGNASGIDVYVYTIIKTASATFTVLASQTQFK